ncbi:MAG: Uma2 family endonuclease, partial [Thiobacillaceae bacterium]
MHALADPLITRHRLSVEDYYRMAEAGILHEDDRVELIEGEIIDMPPIGSLHAGTVKRLASLFMVAVGKNAIVSVQDPVRLDRHSEPQP